MKEVLQIGVGSTNPVKLKAATMGVKGVFSKFGYDYEISVEGINCKSGVKDQPMSHEEGRTGAINRAKDAIKLGVCKYGVGLEGYILQEDGRWYTRAIIIVMDVEGRIGESSTVKLALPNRVMDIILKGGELGPTIDILYKTKNIKHQGGAMAVLTRGLLYREKVLRDAVYAAFADILNQD